MCDLDINSCGYVLTWKIENFICWENNKLYDSPKITIQSLENTEWNLQVMWTDGSLGLWFKRNYDSGPDNVTLNYSISISYKAVFDIKQINGHVSIRQNEHKLVQTCVRNRAYDISEKDELIITCQLWHISLAHSLVTRCFFRSVIRAEHRRINCTIQRFDAGDKVKRLYFLVLSACPTDNPLQLTVYSSQDTNSSENLQLDIRNENQRKVSLHCKISVVGAKGCVGDTTYRHIFQENEDVWTLSSFITKEKLLVMQKLSNDALSFNCEFVISEMEHFSWIEESNFLPKRNRNPLVLEDTVQLGNSELNKDLLSLYTEGKCPDVELIAEGRRLPAHKAVLSARSPVFSAMFANDMQERESNLVEISDVDAETLDQMLVYVYSDVIRDKGWESVSKLYLVSNKYQISTLKVKCSSILRNNMLVQNACEFLVLADMCQDDELRNSVEAFIFANLKNMLQSEEWRSFMEDKPALACATLQKALLKSI